jgi:hypothetical protein
MALSVSACLSSLEKQKHATRHRPDGFVSNPFEPENNYKDIYGRSRDVNIVLYLSADFQHKYRFNLLLPLVFCVEGSLKNGLVLTYIQTVEL